MIDIEQEITNIIATTHLAPAMRAKLILEVLGSYGWHSKSECLKELPEIVCLCGSTRFADAFKRANREETLAGKIVLTIGLNLRTDETLLPMPHGMPIDIEELDKIKKKLDELHLRKIDLATKVMILNVGGYIGESTAREIAYAQKIGKPIVYLEPV